MKKLCALLRFSEAVSFSRFVLLSQKSQFTYRTFSIVWLSRVRIYLMLCNLKWLFINVDAKTKSNFECLHCIYRLHSKNTRVSRDPEKGPLGPNSIPGQRWPGNQSNWQIMGSDWPSSGSYFASSWLIFGSSLTRNGVWPQWTLFRVTLTRVCLECSDV